MRRTHTYSHQTLDAASVLGLEVAAARRGRRWTIAELAERAGVSPVTVRKVERGDPTVALGTAFEVATIVGIRLFGGGPDELSDLVARARDRLALLPERVREPSGEVHDDF
jgi:transcriptional regulator with XRE-family HTH domain